VGSTDLRNVGKLIPVYTALQPRRQPPPYLPPWGPQILRINKSEILLYYFRTTRSWINPVSWPYWWSLLHVVSLHAPWCAAALTPRQAQTFHHSVPYVAHKRLTVVSPPAHTVRVRPSVILAEIDRISHKVRPSLAYQPAEDFLNSRSVVVSVRLARNKFHPTFPIDRHTKRVTRCPKTNIPCSLTHANQWLKTVSGSLRVKIFILN
jgi:hypothetical protein